jgi:hypothetical protein
MVDEGHHPIQWSPQSFFGLLGSQWPFPKGFQLIIYVLFFNIVLPMVGSWWVVGQDKLVQHHHRYCTTNIDIFKSKR